MNIIVIYTSPWWNAAASYAVTVAAGLRLRGHRVAFVTDQDSPAAVRARKQQIAVVHLPLRSRRPRTVLRAVRDLRTMAKDLCIDVINTHSPQGHLLAALGRIPVPVVRTRCDDRPVQRNPMNRWLYAKHARMVVLPSEANRRRLEERIPVREERVRVLYYGMDIDGFAAAPVAPVLRDQLGLSAGRIIVGHLGRLSPEKGPLCFLDIAARAGQMNPDLHFVMTGLPVQYTCEDLLAAGKERGLEGRLSVLPPFDDPRMAMKDFDVGVITSQYSESICRAALEYMALKIPVVSTNVNVLAELFDQTPGGCIFQKDDVTGMADAVVRLTKDPEISKRAGMAGYERAKALYDLPGFVKRTETVLNAVVKGNPS